MDENYFSERLANLRIQKGVSARDMSLSIGQSENYINMIENRKSFPSMTVFFYICDYFGITPKEFFDDETKYPQLLNNLVEDLKYLDEKSLNHIAGLVKELKRK
jgi:Predicted transcriptional regulators